MIRTSETPLTIGVFGEWGSGKTSLMRMVREKLDPPQEAPEGSPTRNGPIITVWFEAWKFAREDVVWRALLLHTVSELRRRVVDEQEDAAERFKELENQIYEDVDYQKAGQLQLNLKDLAMGTVEVASGLFPFGPPLARLLKQAGGLLKPSENARKRLRPLRVSSGASYVKSKKVCTGG
jgi:hypothetical protein